MIKTIIFLAGILILSGCGMMGSSSKKDDSLGVSSEATVANLDMNSTEDTTQIAVAEDDSRIESPADEIDEPVTETSSLPEESSILPQTISMKFPEVLKQSAPTIEENQTIEDNQTTTAEDNQTIKNRLGYAQLKRDIAEIEDVIKKAQVNLILLEKVMPEVLDRCEGMVSCLFKENVLSIVMDNETISAISSIIDDNSSLIQTNGSELFLGQIGFTTYDDNRSYQYELALNSTSKNIVKNSTKMMKDINETVDTNETVDINKTVKERQTFKWSDTNSDVTTTYSYEDNQTKTSIAIHYLIDEDGKEMMHIQDMRDDTVEGSKENMNLILANKDDENNSFTLQTNSIEEHKEGNETNISSFSSNAEITEESSLLLFSGKISAENSNNEVISTSEVICDANESCDTNLSTPTQEASDIELYELKIIGGNLEDGSFVLLPPYADIEQLKLMDIFELSIGTFTLFEDKFQGELHDNSYNDILNRLTIIKIEVSQNSINMFEIVPQRDKPTLKIVKY